MISINVCGVLEHNLLREEDEIYDYSNNTIDFCTEFQRKTMPPCDFNCDQRLVKILWAEIKQSH